MRSSYSGLTSANYLEFFLNMRFILKYYRALAKNIFTIDQALIIFE